MAATERTASRGRPRSARKTHGYLETTIRRLAAKKKLTTEAESLAELTVQAAMIGPIREIWDTLEEDAAWQHLA